MSNLNGGWFNAQLQRNPLCTCGVAPGNDHAFGCALTQSMLSRGQTVTVSDRTVDERAMREMAAPGTVEWTMRQPTVAETIAALQSIAARRPTALDIVAEERAKRQLVGYPVTGLSLPAQENEARRRLQEAFWTPNEPCGCDRCRTAQHASSCAVHNEPAMPAGPCDCDIADDPTADDGDPDRAAAFWTITTSVRDLSQSSRRLFWSELAALVEREWDCPPGYDRTAWAMEHATAGMVDAAYQRVVG